LLKAEVADVNIKEHNKM